MFPLLDIDSCGGKSEGYFARKVRQPQFAGRMINEFRSKTAHQASDAN
jgi:hypothetical protein